MVEITAVSYPYQAMSDPTAVVGRRVLATIVDGLVIVGPAIAVTAAQLDLQYLDSDEVGVSLSTFCDTLESQSDNYVCFQAGDRVYFSEQSPVAGTPVALVIALTLWVGFPDKETIGNQAGVEFALPTVKQIFQNPHLIFQK